MLETAFSDDENEQGSEQLPAVMTKKRLTDEEAHSFSFFFDPERLNFKMLGEAMLPNEAD